MLWIVIDEINIRIRLFFLLNNLLNILSATNNSNPPEKNPTKDIIHGVRFNSFDVSIAGDKREKYDAAVITPAANPSIASIIFLFIFLKKNTIEAPIAVTK